MPLWAGSHPLQDEGLGLIVWTAWPTKQKPFVALGWALYAQCRRRAWRPAVGPLGVLNQFCNLHVSEA